MGTCPHSLCASMIEVVEFLLETSKAKIESGFNGHTLLTEAMIAGHDKTLNYLLDNAVVDVNTKTRTGQTLLHFAAFQNNTEIVKKLVRDCSVNVEDSDDFYMRALYLAAFQGSVEMVQLLDKGEATAAKPTNAINTVLMIAATEGYADVIEYLLVKYNIQVHGEVLKGKTMLDIAHDLGRLDVVKLLLLKGEGKLKIEKLLLNSLDNLQRNVKTRTSLELAHLLINSGAPISPEELTDDGLNILQFAADIGSLEVVQAILERNLLQVV